MAIDDENGRRARQRGGSVGSESEDCRYDVCRVAVDGVRPQPEVESAAVDEDIIHPKF